MRGLAELAMRDKKHALMLAVTFACIPMLFWISAAIISLVVLRHGSNEGLKILAWALLPGIAWVAMHQVSTVICLITTVALACVLRQTSSWPQTLLALLPFGLLVALAIWQLAPQQITVLSELVMKLVHDYVEQDGERMVGLVGKIQPLVKSGVVGAIAWFDLVSCLLGVVLARSWQAQLFNPGGFQKEFHGLRLPMTAAMVLLSLTMLGATQIPYMVVVVPIATLPLLVAGLALIHGLVGIRNMNSFWLVSFYLMLIFVAQLAYPVIVLTACFDSMFDFRSRVANRQRQG